MTAREHIEELKALRLAELKTADDARKHAEDERRRETDCRFTLALGVFLREQNAEWLSEFHTHTEARAEFERTAVFTVPDHATIRVNFSGGTSGMCAIHYTAGYWQVAGTLYMRLDDALLAAATIGEQGEVPL